MIKNILIGLFTLTTFDVVGQSDTEKYLNKVLESRNRNQENIKDELIQNDISILFTKVNNSSVLGFIGDNYQRFRIKLVSVIRNPNNTAQYFVYGKSMVKGNVCEFQGVFEVKKAFTYKVAESPDPIKEADWIQGIITGEFSLFENPKQNNTGIFKGVFASKWYRQKNGTEIKYDDIMQDSDGFNNNQFVGTWTSYKTASTKVCNWGDYRIPMSGDLDMGEGLFTPNKKYINNGWQEYDFSSGTTLTVKVKDDWWK